MARATFQKIKDALDDDAFKKSLCQNQVNFKQLKFVVNRPGLVGLLSNSPSLVSPCKGTDHKKAMKAVVSWSFWQSTEMRFTISPAERLIWWEGGLFSRWPSKDNHGKSNVVETLYLEYYPSSTTYEPMT